MKLITRPLQRKIKDGVVALTLATWCLARPWSHLLFKSKDYFGGSPALPVELLAVMVNVAGLALAIWLGIGLWRNWRGGMAGALLDGAFLLLMVFPADFIRVDMLSITDGELLGFMRRPAVMAGLFGALALLLWKHRPAARLLGVMLWVSFPAALLVLAKLSLTFVGLMPLKDCASVPAAPALLHVAEGRPRVIWMIFDETDYRLAFEKRPANVPLPEFDRLRLSALSADHAYPPGDSTLFSMPALIAGRRVEAARPEGCELAVKLAGADDTADWSALPSVFSRARELGCNTALVGWYHPYARMLGGSLNYCAWYPFPLYEPARSTTFGGAAREQIASLASSYHIRRLYIETCRHSLADAVAAADNPAYGLVLLHLPPPHGPGVYLPEKGQFTCEGIAAPAGYFNNLVLADRELGVLRRNMEAAGLWDKSWVLLSADHSWRKSKLYDGVRDYRVPFVLKSPEAGPSMVCTNMFNTVLTHDLVLAILRNEVTNQAGAAALLARGAPEMPVLEGQHGSSQ